ncbi:MAG: lipoyl synthase [Chloroflexi bacterium RBG_16_68_14]|nr:MAG: lipoyl synthase [Chloroflexi bacterium RBG_16_68_14]
MDSTVISLRERTRTDTRQAKPSWLKVRFPAGERYHHVKALLREHALHTVCEEARCPNIGECFNSGTATFMILGDICTRACGFCAVTSGRPANGLDWLEPYRLARAARTLGLDYVVITSVNRDDQPDGGAAVFAACIRTIRRENPRCRVEVLIPDFMGDRAALQIVVRAQPFVLNHNVETVPRLYRRARPKARYQRSIELLRWAKEMDPSLLTKSGMMVGLGETREEVFQVMADLRGAGVDLVTIGQYLRPSEKHLPVERYYEPSEFEPFVEKGRELGFLHVEAGPLVRSSYHAHRQAGLESAVGGGS